MKRVVPLTVLLLLCNTALAQRPPAKPSAQSCIKPGALAYDNNAELLLVCEDGAHCQRVDLKAKAIASTEGALALDVVHLNGAATAICLDRQDLDCIKLGKRAQATARKAAAPAAWEGAMAAPQVSNDRTFAILDGELWDLKRDKAVRVPSWSKDRSYQTPAQAVGFAGNLVVFTIVPCAGPCAQSRLMTRRGAAVGAPFDGVAAVHPLQGDIYVGATQQGGLARIAPASKQVTIWSAFDKGAVENSVAFVRQGVPTLALLDDIDAKLLVFELNKNADSLVSTFDVSICSP